jgi:transposase
MQEIVKSMNKKEIATMFGWSVATLVKWMNNFEELRHLIIRRGTGTYLYTESEIKLIIKKYTSSN